MDMTWEGIQRAFAAACPVEARQRAETDPKMRRILETVTLEKAARRLDISPLIYALLYGCLLALTNGDEYAS
jgi:hypothetical protein